MKNRSVEVLTLKKNEEISKSEIKSLKDKLAACARKIAELESTIVFKNATIGKLEAEGKALVYDNQELKKRREAATNEINKLTMQLSKRSTQIVGAKSKQAASGGKDHKVSKHLSEAVPNIRVTV